jgi:alpha,alpha-trehalose phosphorylase
MVDVSHQHAIYSLLDGPALEIMHHGKKATVEPHRPLTRRIPQTPSLETPTQPRGRAPRRRRQRLERAAVPGPPQP